MRNKLNYFIDAGILMVFAVCGVTGALKLQELGIAFDMATYARLSILHDWSGVAAVALIAVHLALHARWLSAMTKKAFGALCGQEAMRPKAMPPRLRRRSGLVLVLLAACLLAQSNAGAWARGRQATNASVPQGIDYKAADLKDGTYTGTANGYMPSLSVEVVVENGKIRSVTVIKHNETMRWYNAVANVIPTGIVQAQSTDIDVVSGATSSSHGIMAAVEDALKNARK